MKFSLIENTVFFYPKSWWKNYIHWLLKSSCFEPFGDEKCGLFWAKALIERWYLLITENFLFWTFRWLKTRSFFWGKNFMEIWYLLKTEKFLFWTFRWWEIRSFFHPKCWWKDDIYLVFFLSKIFRELGNMVFHAVSLQRSTQ